MRLSHFSHSVQTVRTSLFLSLSIGYFTVYKLISVALKCVIQIKTNAFQLCAAELIECPLVNIRLIDSRGFHTIQAA